MSAAGDAENRPQNQGRDVGPLDLRTITSRLPPSPAYRRFLIELANYKADEPYLTVDKCAARCRWLSQLLTAAVGTPDE